MFSRNSRRPLRLAALLIPVCCGSFALADETVAFATGGYASQLRTPEMMNKIDTDGDHMVSKKEWTTYQGRLFSMLDVDHSGALDKAEFMSQESKPMVSFATGGFAAALKTPEMWTRLDADHDGSISRDEFLTYQVKIFEAMDSGRTGMLDRTAFFGRGDGGR